jgi:hypothetical protein
MFACDKALCSGQTLHRVKQCTPVLRLHTAAQNARQCKPSRNPASTHTEYTSPSGEKYDGDVPPGHTTLLGAMVPTDATHATVYDWHYDVATGKWRPWEAMLDDAPIPHDTEVRDYWCRHHGACGRISRSALKRKLAS